MDAGLYFLGRALVALVQSLPLWWVARLGRSLGGLAFWLDARHRRVALRNLALCFGAEKSPRRDSRPGPGTLSAAGREYLCAIKTAAMSLDALRPCVTFVGHEEIRRGWLVESCRAWWSLSDILAISSYAPGSASLCPGFKASPLTVACASPL